MSIGPPPFFGLFSRTAIDIRLTHARALAKQQQQQVAAFPGGVTLATVHADLEKKLEDLAAMPARNRFGEIEAVKWFNVLRDIGGSPVLASPYRGVIWPPRKVGAAHRSPDASLETGIYAWRTRGDADAFEGMGQILAEVLLWGVVVEHERGYRAEHCRITRVLAWRTPPGERGHFHLGLKTSEPESVLEELRARYDEVGA